MKRAWLLRALVPLALATAFATLASAQPAPARRRTPGASSDTTPPDQPTNLRARVGTEHAARLIRSDADDRVRGIERAAAIGTPEAVALLVESLEHGDRGPRIKEDSRALLAMARALARYADQDRARAGLLTIVGTANPRPGPRGSASADRLEDDASIARAELARQVAAIALARSRSDRALEALYGVARGGGIGQSAALLALGIHPPRDPGFFGTTGASMPAPVVRLLGQIGDLRALDVLHSAARSSDVNSRCAALVSLAQLGDERAVPLARAAISESDVRLRAAAGEVFILLGAPERFKATSAILSDDATTAVGIKMAERVHDPEITRLLAARALEHPDREIRKGAIRALGRSPDPSAAKALVAPQVLADRELTYDAISALARSPAPNAGALIGGLFPTRLSTMAARAYVVRALVRGERTGSSDDAITRLARSRDPRERAVGVFARVALGEDAAERFLADADPRVRRAAAMGAMASPTNDAEAAFLKRLAIEEDDVTRQVLAYGLVGGDKKSVIKTSVLIERAESGGGDAPLAAYALARRADEKTARKIGQLLSSKDVVLRAHVARGLGVASLPDAAGRLADAYAYETDVEVRRAVIAALAARSGDADAPARKETLAMAAELDPDSVVRQAARRAIAGVTAPFAPPARREVAWLRVTLDGGDPPAEPYVGSIVRSDGIAVPIAFDEEGYAVVPGLPPGEARVVLAPRLPSDKASPSRERNKP
jgi:HEAT repeat protein